MDTVFLLTWIFFQLLNLTVKQSYQHHYTLSDFIKFYNAKFPSQQLLISIPQAITYFDDAEETEDPISLKDQTWESVKKIIQQKVRDFLS